MSRNIAEILVITLALLAYASLHGHCLSTDANTKPKPSKGQLEAGFYDGKCNSSDVELVVGGVVKEWYAKDQTITAALLRMQFHDCFVMGCDASILLDGSSSEKTAIPNLSVRGYDLIDAAKSAVEAVCPGVVSCADIIVMATRDAVALSGGGRYIVQMGRRDGTTSLASKVNLPAPTISVSGSIKAFSANGLNVSDMVYLIGGHTVGVAHCSLFIDRLYNFKNTGRPDPSMDPNMLADLRARCPQNATNIDNTANLDQNPLSAMTVDNSYHKQILQRRGVLQIDQQLALNRLSKFAVATIANGDSDFATRFGQAMVKLGAVRVLTGTQGEVRRSCGAVN